jgi:hypothetical protein
LAAPNPASNLAAIRCDTAETSETTSGGNGISGHDATSENGAFAFKSPVLPTPGAAPASGSCP